MDIIVGTANFIWNWIIEGLLLRVIWPIVVFIWWILSVLGRWTIQPILRFLFSILEAPVTWVLSFVERHILIILSPLIIAGLFYLYRTTDENSEWLKCDPCADIRAFPFNIASSVLGIFYCRKPLSRASWTRLNFRIVAKNNTEMIAKISKRNDKLTTQILDYDGMRHLANEAVIAESLLRGYRIDQEHKAEYRDSKMVSIERFEGELKHFRNYMQSFLQLRETTLKSNAKRLHNLEEKMVTAQKFNKLGWKHMEQPH